MPPDNHPEILLNSRYRIIKKLATGGMAYVYLGYDTVLERTVAIKILKHQFSREKSFRDQFQTEARSAANLNHTNIVTIHDFGYDDQQLFIVMEYVSGVDLKTYLSRHPSLSVMEALRLVLQACDGIGYAHRSGFVHCDVKPQNMLVTHDQKLKVADFGIARAISAVQNDELQDVVWGSPHYFSPEQAAGFPPTPASDVYSLGIVLFEILTGRLPFESNDNNELARMHQNAPIPNPRTWNPEIPGHLNQVMIKILAKDPSSRYRSADQLSIILSGILREHPGLANIQIKPIMDPSSTKEASISRFHQSLLSIDWATIALALIATVAVGGLIPFWFYIWLNLNGF